MDAKTNGALDVLKRIGQYVPNDEFAAYFEAREAGEELIEAVRGGVETRTHNGFVIRYDEVQADRLAAALARVQGGAA